MSLMGRRRRGEFAAALGLADRAPVGGAVAGAAKPLGVDEGFRENGGKAVAVFPIVGELAGGASKDVGGEVFDVDPGKDEEAGIVDHEVEVAFSLLGGPADEAVAGGDGPGGGAESQGGEQLGFAQPLPVGPDEIAKLRPGQRYIWPSASFPLLVCFSHVVGVTVSLRFLRTNLPRHRTARGAGAGDTSRDRVSAIRRD